MEVTIAIGSDHAGWDLKEFIKKFLGERKYHLKDFGVFSPESVDYPVVAFEVAETVAEKKFPVGILCCGTGIGMSLAANKISGIRAAVCTNEYMATMARRHNDANILCLGGRVLGTDLAAAIVETFLKNTFEGGRHARRVGLITRQEEGEGK